MIISRTLTKSISEVKNPIKKIIKIIIIEVKLAKKRKSIGEDKKVEIKFLLTISKSAKL